MGHGIQRLPDIILAKAQSTLTATIFAPLTLGRQDSNLGMAESKSA